MRKNKRGWANSEQAKERGRGGANKKRVARKMELKWAKEKKEEAE